MSVDAAPRPGRRRFLADLGRGLAALFLLGGGTGLALRRPRGKADPACPPGTDCAACGSAALCARASAARTVWQIDPARCVQCGQCATACVLSPSAVKCVHAYSMCGYCKLCFGYFRPGAAVLTEAAENQLCPTGAIGRKGVEDPFFEYTIDEPLCIGCGKCVKGCAMFGNGSLHLQVRHDRCVGCNECSISRACAGDAFRRVPADRPYLFKGKA